MKRKTHFEHVPLHSIGAAAVHDPVKPAPPQKQTRTKQTVRVPSGSASGKPARPAKTEKVVADDSLV
jgi:hypothetical protein